MSSVAVLTQEIFNEHRSGLLPEQSNGGYLSLKVVLYLCHVITAIRHFDLVLVFLIQLLWQEPVLGKRKTPFPPTRRPSRLCLRRQPHRKGPRKLPTPGHLRFVPSSLLLLPRYAIFRSYVLSLAIFLVPM